jgi:hypothetical protein
MKDDKKNKSKSLTWAKRLGEKVQNDDGNEIVQELMSQITKWRIEASSNYNDGWTRQHYQEKLDKLKSSMDKAYSQLLP